MLILGFWNHNFCQNMLIFGFELTTFFNHLMLTFRFEPTVLPKYAHTRILNFAIICSRLDLNPQLSSKYAHIRILTHHIFCQNMLTFETTTFSVNKMKPMKSWHAFEISLQVKHLNVIFVLLIYTVSSEAKTIFLITLL